MAVLISAGESGGFGYRQEAGLLNPGDYFAIKLLSVAPQPGFSERFANIVLAVDSQPVSGDYMEVRFYKLRSPVLQLGNIPEWVNTSGITSSIWVNWFIPGIDYEIWVF